MDKTNYENDKIKLVSLTSIIILLVFTILFGFLTFISINSFLESKESINIIYITGLGLLFIICLFFTVTMLGAFIKAKSIIYENTRKIKKTNPYIYYRELPNPYGVGVATLLMDSTLENEKDVVAVILDLCAKKYLTLRKNADENYTISILKPIDEKLLSNEKYIIECIINNKLNEIDYKVLYNHCMEDGIKLGIFTKNEKLYNRHQEIYNNMTKKSKVQFPITTLGRSIIGVSQMGASEIYNSQMSKYLEPTRKGKMELQKLYSFKAFISDFGMFASKNPEEIVLWDFYLSYAQIFGLADKILETGYDKIIKNSSFEIDNINKISFDKIRINE